MTPKQAILAALNGEITRAKLMEYCGIVNKDGKYVYKRKEVVKKEFTPPSIDEVVSFFIAKGYSKEGGNKFYDYYTVADWKDAKGKQVLNWKQKAIGNWFREEFKIKPTHTMYKPLNI
ncbi:MAG: hypothetical protein WAS34_18895 [Thiolinea sp.]